MGENIMQKRVKWAHKSLALCVILLAKRNNTRPKSGRQHIMQRAHLQTYSHSCNAKQTNNSSSINTRKKGTPFEVYTVQKGRKCEKRKEKWIGEKEKEKGPDRHRHSHILPPADETHHDISNARQFPNEVRISCKILKILDKMMFLT